MRSRPKRQEITFRKPVQIKALRTIDSVLPVTQEIAGSNPVAPAKPYIVRLSADFRGQKPIQKAGAIAFAASGPVHEGSYRTDVIDASLLSRPVDNRIAKTIEMYEANLPRFVRFFTEQTIPLMCVEPMWVETYLD